MIPYQHQKDIADKATEILRAHGITYLACEERTGKTLAAILVAERSPYTTILVVTKKKAIEGWTETLEAFEHTKQYTVTNYHQAGKQLEHDLVILDESHNYISSFPKPGTIWKALRPITKGKPIVYISATPYGQGPQMLYHQFALSSYSPWCDYPNFYSWFKTFGKPYQIEMNGVKINQYDRCDSDFVLGCVDHLFVTATRNELGFLFEPTDSVHNINLDENTKNLYNELVEHQIADLPCGTLVCDTKSKLRTSLHQLEGGTIKIDTARYTLANQEKINYILAVFGDHPGLVIMYNYIQEQVKLNAVFKYATILQATSYAEGIDLHKYSDLVIYSQDFSTARHTQRRARQANKKRDTPITVHFLLVKGGLSEQVYKTVSINKRNYVDSVYRKETL